MNSYESWSSVLTSLLDKNKRGEVAIQVLQHSVKKKFVLKDETTAKCLVVSSHVPTLKHEVEQQLLTQKQLLQLLQETNKQLFLAY